MMNRCSGNGRTPTYRYRFSAKPVNRPGYSSVREPSRAQDGFLQDQLRRDPDVTAPAITATGVTIRP